MTKSDLRQETSRTADLGNGSSRRIVKIEHYLEVVWHGLYRNVGRPTEVIQSHVNAEGRIE